MEVVFDNKTNFLNAHIRATHDNSVMYSITTTFGMRGRKISILKDANPMRGESRNAGVIHWREKAFEVNGHKKPLSEIKRREGHFFKRTRHWSWDKDRKEYEVKYHELEGMWKASVGDKTVKAHFLVPLRPHLFSKPDPAIMHLTKSALAHDEVFMILVLIYSEIKRQDETNSGSGAW